MTRFLLDTIAFDFLINEPERLPPATADVLTNPENTLCLSIVSVWEISIQVAQQKITFTKPFQESILEECIKHDITLIDLTVGDTHQQAYLPFLTIHGKIHKDPFDRLIVAQALRNNLVVISSDAKLPFYPITVLWN